MFYTKVLYIWGALQYAGETVRPHFWTPLNEQLFERWEWQFRHRFDHVVGQIITSF